MGVFPKIVAATLLCSLAMPAIAADKTNLFARPDVQFVHDHSVGLNPKGVVRIKDGNLNTSAQIFVEKETPIELVFGFEGNVVTPSSFKLKVGRLTNDKAKIEILASELSPESGFFSLRAEPLKDTDNWQSFRFEPTAAKWLMVKIIPFGDSTTFDIAELEIEGYDGPPVSLYAFDEAPSDALAVLQSLQQAGVPLNIHPDEKSLFEDAADGELDTWSFAEASLLSSGMYDPALRAKYLSYIDEVIAYVQTDTQGQTPFEKGQTLLTLLHEGPMRNGYLENQTDTSKLLETGSFNCVSSATLYNIIARGIGLDARGIEVPDHAFSILYDGTEHADIETTSVRGFNPARNKAGLSEFERTTGFTYIDDRNRAKRREIDEAGMVALTYYNHGVTASKANDYPTALLYYFRALSLDSRNKSAIKNAFSALGRWSSDAIDQENYPRAVEILDAALRFAPSDRGMRHNMRYALTRALKNAPDVDAQQHFVAMTKDLFDRTQDRAFLRIQSQVVTQRALEHADRGEYEAALALAESLGPSVDERSQRDLKKLRGSMFLNWSNALFDAGDFAKSVDVLDRALREPKPDYRLKKNLAYVVQQWGIAVTASEGTQASQTLLISMSQRFPKIRALQSVAARNYDAEAQAAIDAGDYQTAITIYQSAHKTDVDARRMKRNELAVWSTWGLKLVDQGDFAGALTIFERGLATHPSEYGFKKNIAYIVQEWTGAVAREDGILKAEEMIAEHRVRLTDVSQLKKMQGRYVNEAVNAAKTPTEFEELAPILKEAFAFAASESRYNNIVAYFYQEWASTQAKDFASPGAIAILASGVDDFPDNRATRKMFINAVNRLGSAAIEAQDWDRAIVIFRTALTTLPSERSFTKAIKYIEEQL